MENIAHLLYNHLVSIGLSSTSSKYINMLVLLLILIIVIFTIDFITRKILIKFFNEYSEKSKTSFDDFIVANKVPRNIAHIIPLVISLEFIPIVFTDFQYIENIIEKCLQVFTVILTIWILRSVLNTLKAYFRTLPRLKDKPIDSYIQVIMIFIWTIGIFISFAILTGITFIKFATTIGAASAIILLVFKDTIMGFVASIQVSVNDMVRIGDWITFEKFGADGDVTEITLATVKVQNFDKTITTIPTYALISDSFKNWRGMENSQGRRIKRAVIIKQNSIKYLSNNEIENLKNIEIISTYLNTRQADVDNHNKQQNINKDLLINGRNLTNIGVFRKYIETYIENHSAINKDMMIMTRQLAPTSQGIPIEIYAFSSDKRWKNYEYIMADIFDHIIASVPYFELDIFELPNNFTSLKD
ncbi:MAG: mechanosensitive ion channel [Flavobacteriaceae bacterium]|nr:mechanosensitive ion channel [Flavobacteriaceae bacterium]